MKKVNMDKGDPEYTRWLLEIKKNPPWKSKEKTTTEKVQSVTHPLGEEVVMTMLEQLVKDSGLSYGKELGKGLSRLGVLTDILGNSDEAW